MFSKLLFSTLVFFCLVSCETNHSKSTRPNIVILFADDLGYSDIGCYGGEIKTPNIDQLANEGMRFTQFINASKCAPSRASLLTGLYAIEAGCNGPPAQMINGVTIAELLQNAGYTTMMSGKWHAKETPYKRGFQKVFASLKGAFNYFEPKQNQPFMVDSIIHKPYVPKNPATFYTTDVFTNNAIEFLDKQKNKNSPFLLYVAYNAPHYPLQAWPEDIEKYRGKYMKGWDVLREERFQRQKHMGIVKANWKLSERNESVSDWETFEQKDAADLTMATYAAMVDRMDQNIGRILQKLEEMGVSDNTLVLFLSDNGAPSEGTMWDGRDPKKRPGIKSSYTMVGAEWANASNTPYKEYKRYMFNGGQLTPFIAKWPKVIKNRGSITFKTGHIVDIMPTILEMTGVAYPKGEIWRVPEEDDLLTEWKVEPFSGKSLLPIFQNKTSYKRERLLNFFQGGRMIMVDSMKLVSDGGDGTIQHLYDFPWELYDVKNDATETNNLASEYPELVDSLDQVFRKWINDTHKKTGVKDHPWFPVRLTKSQQKAADELLEDKRLQTLLSEREKIGHSIVKELNVLDTKMKRGLGMDKVPMSYFGLVEEGRQFKDDYPNLIKLYNDWDLNIKKSIQYCKEKGSIYLQVWKIQERIRPKIPAYDFE